MTVLLYFILTPILAAFFWSVAGGVVTAYLVPDFDVEEDLDLVLLWPIVIFVHVTFWGIGRGPYKKVSDCYRRKRK